MELINHPTDIYNKGTTKSSIEAIRNVHLSYSPSLERQYQWRDWLHDSHFQV